MDHRGEAAPRPTEGRIQGEATQTKILETRRQRGRPKGSRNKPKSLLPTELAGELLLQMKDILPPDHYDYIRKVVREGAAVSVQREVQIMLLILGRNLMPALLEEGRKKDDDGEPQFRRDVTERLKVWNSLAGILHQTEKNSDEGTSGRAQPILTVFKNSGTDPSRLRILLGIESGSMGGSPDGVGGPEVEIGTIPDQLLERSLDIQDSEQVETIGIFDSDRDRNDPLGSDEEEL